jgi:hypothetical protein
MPHNRHNAPLLQRQLVSIVKKKKIAFHCENHMGCTNGFSRQNAEFIKVSGLYNKLRALRAKIS